VGPIIDSVDSWLLVPAPPDLTEPAYSFDSYEIPLYSAEMVATAILTAPGRRLGEFTRPCALRAIGVPRGLAGYPFPVSWSLAG
jgi:hypothetical protein